MMLQLSVPSFAAKWGNSMYTNEELSLALDESDIDLPALLAKAIERRNQALDRETAKLKAAREQRRIAAEEEVALAYRVFQGAIFDGLKAAFERRLETRYLPNETEEAMALGKIPFQSANLRSSSYRYIPDYYSNLIHLARQKLSTARQKLRKIESNPVS